MSHYTWASEVDGIPVTYAFTYGAARFIIINTEYNVLDSDEQAAQAAFVKNEVQEAKALGQWTIVEFHKPIYTGANHLDDADTITGRKYWSSVLSGIGVDAVLAGHDHVLSRGFVKADGTKADVTTKVYDRTYLASQPDHAPLHYVANCGSTLKFYAPLPNNDWIDENDPIAPDYGFLDINSALPAGDELNPDGPCTNDDLEGTDPEYLRYPTFVAVTLSDAEMKLDAWMTGFDRNSNYIAKETFLYDSLTIQRDGVSSGITETEQQLKRVRLIADGNTISRESSVNLNLTGKDYLENELDLSSFTIVYKEDVEGVVNISEDGIVTLHDDLTESASVKVWAEVTDGEKTVISDKVSITAQVVSEEEEDVTYVPDVPWATTITAPIKNALDDMEERPDGTLDYDSSDLEITWEKDDNNQLIGLRFADLPVPAGATVLEAYIQFSVDEADKNTDPFKVKIYAENTADAAPFENINNTVSSRSKTAGYISWKNIPFWTVEHEAGPDQQTPNLAPLVQEIVNKEGWSAGNALSFILKGEGRRSAESYEGSGGVAEQIPTLHLTYITDTKKIIAPIKNSLDDMEERPDGSLDYDSSDLEITWEKDDNNQLIGLRFEDLSIPKEAVIIDAYVQFSVDEADKNTDPFDVQIYAEDSPDAAPFENITNTVSSRTKIADYISWKNIPFWTVEHEAGPDQQTPNLAPLVQEIVNKEGWSAGNALSFILKGEGRRSAESYEGSGGVAEQIPTLYLRYAVPDSSELEGVNLKLIGRYYSSGQVGVMKEAGTEIVDYDPVSQKVFIANGADSAMDIVDLNTLSSGQYADLPLTQRIVIADLELGVSDITSVAVNRQNDLVAVAVPASVKTDNGMVVFLNKAGTVINTVSVGTLPDMITFTPDGSKLLVANEGEPNDDYTVDPVGSVSIIDLAGGAENAVVHNVFFDGVFYDPNVRIFGNNGQSTPQQDFEPEYIAVENNSTAYVVLQENNAIAGLDIDNKVFTHIYGLGFKDHSLTDNGLDASDKDSLVNIQSWPVLGMYLPDGISMFNTGGKSYVLTANEGDARDYDAYSEEERVKDIKDDIELKAENYGGYNQSELDALLSGGLFDDNKLGRLKITTANGKNASGKYESLYSYGARSFSIWNADDFSLVYDSGDDFEKVIFQSLPDYFNVSNSDVDFDSRSDDKGPEPEDVEVGKIGDHYYAFIGMERISGIMVYDITDPAAPKFATYFNSRDFSADVAGDVAPEGLKFIPGDESPTGTPILLAAHEVSGTVAVYEITGDEEQDGWNLTVMHTNDTHAHLDNIARRTAAIERIRSEASNNLLLDAGDVFSGTLYFTQYQGQADLEFMNMLGYDAMALGNHEFDKGPHGLAKFLTGSYTEGYQTAPQFPLVNANFDFSNEPALSSLAQTTVAEEGTDLLGGRIYPAVILDVNGEKVGILGLDTEDTEEISSPGGNININDAFTAAANAVSELSNKGINKIIALTHLGWDRDLQLAQDVEGIDIIVGGHSHTDPADYPAVVDAENTPTVVVQAGEHGQLLGRLNVSFDADGKIIQQNGLLLDVTTYAEDTAVAARLAEYADPLEELENTVVGSTQVN